VRGVVGDGDGDLPHGWPVVGTPAVERSETEHEFSAHVVGISKIAYVLTTPRGVDWRHDLQ